MSAQRGSFRLFRVAQTDVYLHWLWFVIAAIQIAAPLEKHSSIAWNALAYVTLFALVLMHEFGHVLSCRQVGGRADRILLWPFGGIAYVSPPPRPGATLWSLAAGPLVNVTLLPVLSIVWLACRAGGWAETMPNVYSFVRTVWAMNTGLLVFNLLPIYPLDGGQILRSLLWFVLGRARSLMVTTVLGFVGCAALLLGAALLGAPWLGMLSVFILIYCWGGLQHARALAVAAKAPRRDDFACPACQAPPPAGALWVCGQCHTRFDTFVTGAICPKCQSQFLVTACFDCGQASPIRQWAVTRPVQAPREPELIGSL